MSLSTLYAFLAHDVLGNVLATFLIAGTAYTVKKLRTGVRKRNDQTHDTSQ
ncbi:hypothetical protein [Streptomyces sp. ISL-86]|uniref:hypothetical protein n=1 Tax=Streptomyces sp. ISL-86 TaxID=2819187 RepID=UPI001BEB06F6|nr:hypothetical protein [Streptomyces sp. ISL-86]MBT2454890.1 hypothetical protein [Streptomyces sp. ISL-86]